MNTTTKPNYWSILGLEPNSDLSKIKTAFRTEARRWHPDLNINDVNAEERFKLVNEAYAILSDPGKRKTWEASNNQNFIEQDFFSKGFPTYKEYVRIVLEIGNNDSYEDEYPSVKKEEENNYVYNSNQDKEIYDQNDSFKPTTSPSNPPPTRQLNDIETVIELTPEEALFGTNIELQLKDQTIVEISTPPFSGDGWRLCLSGVVLGGNDHFIQLRVQTEDGLRIDGLRVLYKLELFPHDALFGCAVDVPTLDGFVTLQVPPKSSTGRLLRLRGRGLEFSDMVGDQIVEIIVVLPADLSESELALYRRLQELALEENSF